MVSVMVNEFKPSGKWYMEFEVFLPKALVELGPGEGYYSARKYLEKELQHKVEKGRYLVIMDENIVGYPMMIKKD